MRVQTEGSALKTILPIIQNQFSSQSNYQATVAPTSPFRGAVATAVKEYKLSESSESVSDLLATPSASVLPLTIVSVYGSQASRLV